MLVQLSTKFRFYWANKTINYSILMLFTLLGVVIPAWYYHKNSWVTLLILGVIAAALAESDDSFSGRIKSLIPTFFCFSIATFSIELLFSTPWLFAIGLFTSTIGFVMLGAIGSRYASIAFGSLIIAIYTMLGAHQSVNLWFQPLLLLSGAAWYYIVSILWHFFAPMQPVQQNLAAVFLQLANYLDAKKTLFHPSVEFMPKPYRVTEANFNAATVDALNQCKMTLLNRSKRGRIHHSTDRFLSLYFLAQDIHERINSTHYRYQELAHHFERSDILFRFKHLLEVQAETCRAIAQSIQLGVPYQHSNKSAIALDELQYSLDYLQTYYSQTVTPTHVPTKASLAQLNYLFTNLVTVEKLFNNIDNPNTAPIEDDALDDTEAHSLKTMWLRIKAHCHLESPLFRHALRLATALTAGYGIIQLFSIERGYWILLTTLFVCQPNYSATKQKLIDRIIGTLAGLLIGGILLTLFPSPESQLVLIVFSGVMFFAFRLNNYSYATAFITLLVLFCFHQLGEGYVVILPRLLDTVIGCALAVITVLYLLPDWQSKRLHKVMAEAIAANSMYLDHAIAQYRIGKKDSLGYRIARRNAHDQDARLTISISNMQTEPGKYRLDVDESFRFLTLNHTLLSYISALGAHRTQLDNQTTHKLILDSHRLIHQHLVTLSSTLLSVNSRSFPQHNDDFVEYDNKPHDNDSETGEIDDIKKVEDDELIKRLAEWREEDDSSARMVLQQLHLIYRMLPELQSLIEQFVRKIALESVNPLFFKATKA